MQPNDANNQIPLHVKHDIMHSHIRKFVLVCPGLGMQVSRRRRPPPDLCGRRGFDRFADVAVCVLSDSDI